MSSDCLCATKVDKHSRNSHKLKFSIKSLITFFSKNAHVGKNFSSLLEPQKAAPNVKTCSKATTTGTGLTTRLNGFMGTYIHDNHN